MLQVLFQDLFRDTLLILFFGLMAGLLCQRLGLSMLVGYLLVGTLLGDGGLGWITGQQEIEYIAHAGVLLLLFAIGIEFSLEELARLGRLLVVGGGLQMLLVILGSTGVLFLLGFEFKWCLLVGSVLSLSSTVLVFKSLSEVGQLNTSHGRRAVGILLFQDVALVPLLLVMPLLTGQAGRLDLWGYALLALKAALFIGATVAFRWALRRWIVDLFASLKNVELVLIFSIVSLSGAALLAEALGLPASVGALAAGLAFSGNRMTEQVDALLLPFREAFAAVFFVSLGLLLRPGTLAAEAHLLFPLLAGMLLFKTGAAAVALRATGLRWRASLGMGLGLSQVGELSFVLLLQAGGAFTHAYQPILFLAFGSMLLTPFLIRLGLRWTSSSPEEEHEAPEGLRLLRPFGRAVVVGAGPVGARVASHLDSNGYEVCMVDRNPVNLYRYAQAGLQTVSGDAASDPVLHSARVSRADVAVICVSTDDCALRIIERFRGLNKEALLLVRCRFVINSEVIKRAGADFVISEEERSGDELLNALQRAHHSRSEPKA